LELFSISNWSLKHESRIIIHPSEKCDIFNKQFADISNIENEPNLLNEDFARDNTCPELLITEQEVKDQLEILNNSNAISLSNRLPYRAIHKRLSSGLIITVLVGMCLSHVSFKIERKLE
jgi:hypothetical protein